MRDRKVSPLRRWLSRCAMIAAVSAVSIASASAQVVQTNVNGFGDRQNSYAWSMAWFNGKLYVGTSRNVLCVERATLFYYFPLLGPILTPYSDPTVPCPVDPVTGSLAANDLDSPPTWSLQAEIWQYTPGAANPGTGTWKRVYQSPADLVNPKDNTKFVSRDIGFRDMVEFKEPNGKTALYVAGVSASEYLPGLPPPRILRSEDGENWAPIPQDPGTFMGDLMIPCDFAGCPLRGVTFRAMKVFDKRLFVTASPGLTGDGVVLEASEPSKGNDAFRLVSDTNKVDTLHVFDMEVFNGQLYIGTGNTTTGYGVYRTTAKAKNNARYVWEPILTDGAGRGAAITSVVSMHVFKGRLYVGSSGWQTGQLPGSELIRIGPNNVWDVVVGNPRQVGSVVKSPISGIPDSFGNPFNFHFWRMQEDHGVLSLTTNDGSFGFRTPLLDPILQSEYGFDMFATNDGVFWTQLTKNGFNHPFDFGGRTMASTKVGLFIGTANHAYGTAILLGDFPRPLPSQLTRLTGEIEDDATLLAWDRTSDAVSARILRAEYTQKPPDQGPVELQQRPGELFEVPQNLMTSEFVEVGQTDQAFFVDATASRGSQYIYRVEPITASGAPIEGSNIMAAPFLITPSTINKVAAKVAAMKGSIKDVTGWTPIPTLVDSIQKSLKSGNLTETKTTAEYLYQEIKLNPGVITSPLDAEELEILVDQFLRRINIAIAGVLEKSDLK